jgi:hypothetical protein
MRLLAPANRVVVGLAAIALALVLCAFAGAGRAAADVPAGQIGIQLLDAPLSQQNDPRAHEYIVDQLASGGALTRHLEITNMSATTQQLHLYAAGATVGDGNFSFADGATANDLSSWTTLSLSTVALAPGKATTISAAIAVPAGASGGERYAVIWAQASVPATAGSVGETNRVGIRVYLDVAGTASAAAATPASTFEIGPLQATRASSGQPEVTANVHNTGAQAIDLSGTLTLADGPGAPPALTPIDKVVTIAPGDTQPVRFILDPTVVDGPWRATVALASGDLTRSASATVTFRAISKQQVLAPPSSSPSTPSWPLAIGGLAIVSILATSGFALRGRARPRPVSRRAPRHRLHY